MHRITLLKNDIERADVVRVVTVVLPAQIIQQSLLLLVITTLALDELSIAVHVEKHALLDTFGDGLPVVQHQHLQGYEYYLG